MSQVKHARSSARLRKGVVVSTAALLLPVLGAAPAFADEGGQAGENGQGVDRSAAASENGQGQEHSADAGANGQGAQHSANAGANGQGAGRQAAGEQTSSGQATQQSAASDQSGTGTTQGAPADSGQTAQADPSQEQAGSRPNEGGDLNNDNAEGNGANTSGEFDAQDTTTTDEGGQVQGSQGKADDKNPPGQVGNTQDNGYECDENSGIGDAPGEAPGSKEPNASEDTTGNPAHTGCDKPQTTGNPPSTTTTGDVPGATVTTATVPPADDTRVLDAALVRLPASAARVTALAAQQPTLVPQRLTAAPTARPTLTPTTLPFTGDGTGLVVLLALTSLSVGGGLVVAGRRSQTA